MLSSIRSTSTFFGKSLLSNFSKSSSFLNPQANSKASTFYLKSPFSTTSLVKSQSHLPNASTFQTVNETSQSSTRKWLFFSTLFFGPIFYKLTEPAEVSTSYFRKKKPIVYVPAPEPEPEPFSILEITPVVLATPKRRWWFW
ncbi:hypothetical protein HDU92_007258 [Lobulomyces angularis]|nr:hypothetical protein HDU92_007258 [Lobulomyces angularis]